MSEIINDKIEKTTYLKYMKRPLDPYQIYAIVVGVLAVAVIIGIILIGVYTVPGDDGISSYSLQTSP